jgi:diacylglycerol kinase (ATP)
MKEPAKEIEAFSLIKRMHSFTHAWRGICIMVRTQHNAWLHILAALLSVAFGVYFDISITEWLALIISIGVVLIAEAFNTAIEVDINLTSPEYHPFARDTKDIAAGAVLIAALTALTVGCIIFLPKFFVLLS